MSKETKSNNETNECCTTEKCCGFEKSSVAKLLRHVADFFDSKKE